MFNRFNKTFWASVIFFAIVATGFFAYLTYSNYKVQIAKNQRIELPQSELPQAGSPADSQGPSETPEIAFQGGGSAVLEKPLSEKSILMVTPYKEFNDEEYFIVKQYFLAAGVKNVLTASNQTGTAVGINGGEAAINLLLKDVKVSDFDAVVFIGGPGALKYLDNEDAYEIAKETVRQGKLLSAISSAPAILAKSGVLKGKRATAWSNDSDKSIIEILQANAAIVENNAIVKDGRIITASGEEGSADFSLEIINFFIQ